MYKQLGSVIRRIREQRKWSLGDLAEKLEFRRGADTSGLQRLERGTKRAPLDLYAAVASAFEMPLSELISAAERQGGLSPEVLLPEERELLVAYRVMESSAQQHYLAIAKGLANKE